MVNGLKLIVLDNCKKLGEKVEKHLKKFRKDNSDLIIPITISRFNNGEGKVIINESARGKDVFILSDISNYSLTYKMNTFFNHYSPDDHYRDIIRVISAIKGHAKRINVVMPLLYESRQHRRKARESLDCAYTLQELTYHAGVHTIITFDTHDPNICNALPQNPFENIFPTSVLIKDFLKKEKKRINIDNLILIAPDVGAVERASFYSNIFQTELGIFTKFRDYTKVTEGKNKIISHRYSGPDLNDKDTIVVDDIVATGDSMIDVMEQLKEKNVKNVYFIATFALFTNGINRFKEAYKKKLFTKFYTTNLSYIPEEYKKEPWLEIIDCSYKLAEIIYATNQELPLSDIIDDKKEIADLIKKERKELVKIS